MNCGNCGNLIKQTKAGEVKYFCCMVQGYNSQYSYTGNKNFDRMTELETKNGEPQKTNFCRSNNEIYG